VQPNVGTHPSALGHLNASNSDEHGGVALIVGEVMAGVSCIKGNDAYIVV
jgi:hypothetical protein